MERRQLELETVIAEVLTPLDKQIRAQAHRDALPVDGLVVLVSFPGQNVP